MKSGVKRLGEDGMFQHVRLELLRRYGARETAHLWKQSGDLLEELLLTYRRPPRRERRYLEKNILPTVAVYQMLQATHPEDAMDIMESVSKTAGTVTGGRLGKLISRPGMKGLFMWLFPKVTRRRFGASAGFRQEIAKVGRRAVMVDIYDCPCCRYCRDLGCPELTHIFCDSDGYSHGSLPGIRYQRTGTLAGGAARCSFTVERVRSKE